MRQVTAHAVALTAAGPAGTRRRHSSRSATRRSPASDATYAPAGPTPRVSGSHHCSNVAYRTRTVSAASPRQAEPSPQEEPGQLTLADTGQVRLIACRRVELTHPLPEHGQRAAAVAVIPHASGDDTAGTGNPAHLAQARDRIGHEVHRQLREGDIEDAIGEGQPLGRRQPDIDAGQALTHRVRKRPRRFHRANRLCAQPAHKLGRQRAGPAPDIQCPLAAADRGQIGEPRCKRLRIPPHEAPVSGGADVETHPPNLLGACSLTLP